MKRNTIRKRMSLREYVNLMNYFKTGELEMDLSDYEPSALSKVTVRAMRFNAEEKAKMDMFFSNNPFGVSVQSVLDTIPKVKVQPVIQNASYSNAVVLHSPANVTQAPIVVTQQEMPSVQVADTGASTTEELIGVNDMPWLVDKAGKIEPGNIDMTIMVDMIEQGYTTEAKIIEQLGVDPEKILGEEPHKFVSTIDIKHRYSFCMGLYDTLMEATKVRGIIDTIMTEEEPSEEEQFERYSKYFFGCHGIRDINKDLFKDIMVIGKITSVDNDKIVPDDDAEDAYVYDDGDKMHHDIMFLAGQNKIDIDMPLNVLGKKSTVRKIVNSAYKKFPNGLPDHGKFYHTRKEAYEDGALKL